MKRSPLFQVTVRTLAMAILVVVPAAANAPADQYEKFVSTTGAIQDKQTQLIWQRVPTTATSQAQAATFCSTSFSGRLPTIKELLTLLDEAPHQEYDEAQGNLVQKMIDPDAFAKENTPIGPFWSSTRVGASDFMTLDFGTGAMAPAPQGNSLFFRCVK